MSRIGGVGGGGVGGAGREGGEGRGGAAHQNCVFFGRFRGAHRKCVFGRFGRTYELFGVLVAKETWGRAPALGGERRRRREDYH